MICTRFKNEPICDYSVDANVKGAERAIRALEKSLDAYYPAVIGGRDVKTEKTIVSLCPALPDRVVGRVASCTRAHVDEAVAEARKAFASWSRTDPEVRAETLMKLAALIRRDRFDFLALLSCEIGKDWYEADAEIAEAIDFCEYYARLAVTHFQYQPLTRIPSEDNCFTYIPLGVGAVIAPWNFPLAILAGMTMAAVVSGQHGDPQALLATRRRSPRGCWPRCARGRRAAGVSTCCPGAAARSATPGHPSRDALRRLHRLDATSACASTSWPRSRDPGSRWIKRVVAEMGGKDAIVVDEPPTWTRPRAAWSRSAFGYQGQKCSACSRLIVRLGGEGPPGRADPREDEAAAGGPAVERPLRLHRAGGERQGAGRHPRGASSGARRRPGCWRAGTRSTGRAGTSRRPCSTT